MIQRILQTSPAVFIAFITALVTFLVGLGLITQAHADSVVSIAAVVVPVILQILAGFIIRGQVYSPNTVAKLTGDETKLKP